MSVIIVSGGLIIDWSFTSSPLSGGTWVLGARDQTWVLNSCGNTITIT